MTYFKQHLCNIFLLLTFVGCGGGGDESNNSEPSPLAAASTPSVTPDQTTENLVSNTTFQFASGFELTVTLMPLGGESIKYFVNICSDFELVEEEYAINYDSCVIRAVFTTEKQVFDVSLSSAETELLAQVWPIENDAIALNYFWSRSEDGADWNITIEK